MLARIVRVLVGFALGCLAAAVTLVLFVYAPSDWESALSDLNGDRLSEVAFFAFFITPHVMIAAALPGLLAVTYAEMNKVTTRGFYALAGIGTAAVGFLFQLASETTGRFTLFQWYAAAAFAAAGLVGGLVYWASAGRRVATPAKS